MQHHQPIIFALALAACGSQTVDTGGVTTPTVETPAVATPAVIAAEVPEVVEAVENASPAPVIAAAVTHGVALGEVTHHSLVVWARGDREARMNVRLEHAGKGALVRAALVSADDDFTGSVVVDGLEPATEYSYAVWFSDPPNASDELGASTAPEGAARGTVRTAPDPAQNAVIRFAWGGDLAGQDVCRDRARGFAIAPHLAADRLDFFIALGDLIYADNACTERGMYGNEQIPGPGPATDIQGYWAHWKYAREDLGYRDFLARVPVFPVWDDHEVVNDAGPEHDTRSQPPYTADARLMPVGLRAFLDYNPVPRADGSTRMYRSARWGKHLEMFFLDTRQYRASNRAEDMGETPKSMLGAEQRAWLEDGLTRSDATWKVVVSSVPMSIPTGHPPENGRDGWADYDQTTGFERELLGILRALERAGVTDTVWLTTDVHFAAGFRYTPFSSAPAFQVHEWISGPLNAGLFPIPVYDRTLRPERLFMYAPEAPDSLSYEQALDFMNYGRIDIDERGALTVSIINGRGRSVYQRKLEPPELTSRAR